MFRASLESSLRACATFGLIWLVSDCQSISPWCKHFSKLQKCMISEWKILGWWQCSQKKYDHVPSKCYSSEKCCQVLCITSINLIRVMGFIRLIKQRQARKHTKAVRDIKTHKGCQRHENTHRLSQTWKHTMADTDMKTHRLSQTQKHTKAVTDMKTHTGCHRHEDTQRLSETWKHTKAVTDMKTHNDCHRHENTQWLSQTQKHTKTATDMKTHNGCHRHGNTQTATDKKTHKDCHRHENTQQLSQTWKHAKAVTDMKTHTDTKARKGCHRHENAQRLSFKPPGTHKRKTQRLKKRPHKGRLVTYSFIQHFTHGWIFLLLSFHFQGIHHRFDSNPLENKQTKIIPWKLLDKVQYIFKVQYMYILIVLSEYMFVFVFDDSQNAHKDQP